MLDTAAAARLRLVAMRGVTIFDRPAPRCPAELATVMAGIRCYDVTATPGGALARFHIGMNEHLTLRVSPTLAGAFDAIADHVDLIGHLPAAYSPQTDAAERAAVEAVRAA